ncbi:GNAT family N-acetyltransferase [Halobacillus salinus]|uniref:N-acetyltransferase n=1 Tax=Halobacillus salinus TaxID=192814 RepID=A0A4Z0GXK7_9BACI|nr:GNAT family N-acetyltransferase [Halobacillus salinus]TGB01394.1 N-acetyltransferase [Halobacillus salinus]
MYQYFHGFIIREGTDGVPAEHVHDLFKNAGWTGEIPEWQKEKYTLMFQHSTWAFTVWKEEQMIGMVRVISDRVMAATIMDLIVHSDFRGKGIGQKLIALCVQKLPHGDWFANTAADRFSFYEQCGFEVNDLTDNGTCVYHGYIQAGKEGHRP